MSIYEKVLNKTKTSLDLHWYLGNENVVDGSSCLIANLYVEDGKKVRISFYGGRKELKILFFKIPKANPYISINCNGVRRKEVITFEESEELMKAIQDSYIRKEIQNKADADKIIDEVLE